MRWAIPLKTKGESVEALQHMINNVADPEDISIGTIRYDEGGKFEGRHKNLADSFGIKRTSNTLYIPRRNAVAG